MSQEQDSIAKDLEDILKKTIEINTQYFKEGSNLVGQLSNSNKQKKTINPFQPELVAGAFTAFAKLNLNHYKNMVDLSFEFSKKIINSDFEASNDHDVTHEENITEPAFVLTETVFIGSSAQFQFVLDNTKEEEAICTLKNFAFIKEEDSNNTHDFKTTFTPQSFQLNPGESQTIKIKVKIGAKVEPGNYQSKVQVLGFEPAHFLINLNVVKKPTKTSANEQ